MISFALAKELKTAGYPQTMIQRAAGAYTSEADPPVHFPTLEELLGACGGGTVFVFHSEDSSTASAPSREITAHGATPVVALAHLWIALNPKPSLVSAASFGHAIHASS